MLTEPPAGKEAEAPKDGATNGDIVLDEEANDGTGVLRREASHKKKVMKIKLTRRQLDSDDEDESDDEDGSCKLCRTWTDHCVKLQDTRRWLRRWACCKGINILRLADTFCMRRCFQVCISKKKELVIPIPVKSVDVLLDNEGPFAFPRIHGEIINFLIEKTWDEILPGQKTRLVIHSMNPGDKDRAKEVSIAINNSFRYEMKLSHYQIIRRSADGTASCLMAVIFVLLVLAVLIPLNITYASSSMPGWLVLLEAFLVIVFWVVIWNPMDALIFGRHMLRVRRQVCKTLASSVVEINPIDSSRPEDSEYDFDEVEV